MSEHRGCPVRSYRLHLEDAAVGAVLRLDLHGQPRARTLNDEGFAVDVHADVAGQREALVVGNLVGEDDGPAAARDVERVRCTGQSPVPDAERGRIHGELDVLALYQEAAAEGARGNEGLRVVTMP